MTAIGRPRSFDADEALEAAMLVFWRHGYEGASLTDLTAAMGITRTSMYAAFGNKEELFRKALARYDDGPASYALRAVDEPTAHEVAKAFLEGAVLTTTRPDGPQGCLGVQGSLAAGEAAETARQILAEWRDKGRRLLETRFRRAVSEGDLPTGTDAGRLALYVITVGFGISVQAASGVSRADLRGIADTALHNWPVVQSH
ncbi:TetR/AcrR family transcriptional regulator [Lentzea sp. NBRC 102530]|uniref:TetR/AcrR family transcriptional regulator n=1 Tax=Lentzea sp. NBRC 102530 TaxID=3032201 RepID=UPI0024A414C5|nr:TetR/AcrR family transcriptional regulator [Lentzea sp. NBRC 102530]GLY46597.1 TetR family transcriptional regulator [Lentzea sp. NBRC 102530]